jgi:hypothetical protein
MVIIAASSPRRHVHMVLVSMNLSDNTICIPAVDRQAEEVVIHRHKIAQEGE